MKLSDKSRLQSLPYDIFLNHVVDELKPTDIYNLCKSSDEILAMCDHRNGKLYEIIAKKYLLSNRLPDKEILPYISTTIWDKHMTPIIANSSFRIKYHNTNDFVVPDIVFESYAMKLKIKLEALVTFFFREPKDYHIGMKYRKSQSGIDDIFNSKTSLFVVIPVEFENDKPILIDNKVQIIGELNPYLKFPENKRYLINGIIIPSLLADAWQNYLILQNFIKLNYEIEFEEYGFKVRHNEVTNIFTISNPFYLRDYDSNLTHIIDTIFQDAALIRIYTKILINNKFVTETFTITGKIQMNGKDLY